MTKNQADYSASFIEETAAEVPQATGAISNKKISVAADNFFYTGSNVLKNKPGIKNLAALKKQYTHDIEKAVRNLRNASLPERIDSSYLKHIHQCLFSKTFEWAGHTRAKPFQFADGSVAFTSLIKRKEFKNPFAPSETVEEGLRNLDQELVNKNYLRGLSRQEFIEHATGLIINLQHLHPFREGNRCTIWLFTEKLAQSVGYSLDFSSASKTRKMFVSREAINNANPAPMKHLLEDVSNPKKVLILNEFTREMQKLGLNKKNYHFAAVAQDGKTYHGIFRGCGYHGFMMDVNGAYILGSRKDLSPKQLETLKIGDRLSFTAPLSEEAQKILAPQKILEPLTKEEIVERIQNTPSVQEYKKNIQSLCKTIYGKRHILQKHLREIHENPAKGEQIACQILAAPRSISKLAGVKICGIKNGTRIRAEESIMPLCTAINHYAHIAKEAEKDILRIHYAKRKCYRNPIEEPNKQIKDLFPLSKEQQKEILLTSPELRAQLSNYFQTLNARLSSDEQRAIAEKHYVKLAEELGSSLNQAEQIAAIFTQTKKMYSFIQQPSRQMSEPQRQDLYQPATASVSEQSARVRKISTKQEKVAETVKQHKALKEPVRSHKTGYVLWEGSSKSSPQANATQMQKGNAVELTKQNTTAKTQIVQHTVKHATMESDPERSLEISATQTHAENVVKFIKQNKAVEKQVQSHKAGYVSWKGGREDPIKASIAQTQQKNITEGVKQEKTVAKQARQCRLRAMSI